MSNPVQPIIIVKKKGGHAGHHGGAWKVAYADFVTAMMAFFLVMWLVNQSKAVKAGVGGYFRDPVGIAEGGRGVLPGADSVDEPKPQAPVENSAEAEKARLEATVVHIKEGLDQVPAFQTLREQVEFSVTAEGLRIDLIEMSDSSFFDSGSAVMHGETERILAVISKELGALTHDVVVEGHTDSRPYTTNDRYSNWELSTDRANAARRAMEREGLQGKQITAVRGLADRQLRVPADPFDARNRRVSILVKSPVFKETASVIAPSAAPMASAEPAAAPSVAEHAAASTTPSAPAPAATH